jgi:hypothetical protein
VGALLSLRQLPLRRELARRIGAYAASLDVARVGPKGPRLLDQAEHAKSDYWKLHSGRARLEVGDDWVRIAGDSGFYIPAEPSAKRELAAKVRRAWKQIVVAGDRRLGLSAPHALMTSLPADLAYDYVFSRRVAVEDGCYADNPHYFDLARVKPHFATYEQLRDSWFLRGRFQAAAPIVHSAFYHALFNHFRDGEAPLAYLEIGAGNGNLASFFHYYDRARVVIVDLPETILYSASYLGSIFPEANVLLPNEADGSMSPRDYDFVFLTPAQTELLPDRAFDLVVNCFSMQEMTRAQVAEYFEVIACVGKARAPWCNVNRVEKFCTRAEPPTRAAEYPYDSRSEVLVDQIDEFMQLMTSTPHLLHIERLPS